ncbi:MAG: dihydrofolate reductase [Bacteroidota bacterium]
MIISAIAAMSKNRVIGKAQDLPWHMPGDLKFFKRTTLNHHVIMGRSTFEPARKALPKRTNIILTRNRQYTAEGVIIAHSIEEGLKIAEQHGEEEAFICGGGHIYKQSIPLWDKLYLTEIDTIVEDGDAFFPEFDRAQFNIASEQHFKADDKNPFDYSIFIYERKSK